MTVEIGIGPYSDIRKKNFPPGKIHVSAHVGKSEKTLVYKLLSRHHMTLNMGDKRKHRVDGKKLLPKSSIVIVLFP